FKLKIAHLDFEVLTEAPESYRAWFNQRRSWWSGNFRQVWMNIDHMWRFPLWLFYNIILVWLMLSGKFWGIATGYERMPMIVVIYTMVTIVANWQVRSAWMLIYPYYALMQVMLMPVCGIHYYFKLAR